MLADNNNNIIFINFFCSHVTLPRPQLQSLVREYKEQIEVAPLMKKLMDGSLLAEQEWRDIGVMQR